MFIKDILIKVIGTYTCRYKIDLDFYITTPELMQIPENGREYFEATDLKGFEALREKYGFSFSSDEAVRRFENFAHFCLLVENGEYGCWCWYAISPGKCDITEIDRTSPVPDNAIVYFDAFTNEKLRGRGLYTEILKRMICASKKPYAILYVLKSNAASVAAIKKSGFVFVKNYNYKTYKDFETVIKIYEGKEQ